MPSVSYCPVCKENVTIPDGVAENATLRCPHCQAQFSSNEVVPAATEVPPVLVLVDRAPDGEGSAIGSEVWGLTPLGEDGTAIAQSPDLDTDDTVVAPDDLVVEPAAEVEDQLAHEVGLLRSKAEALEAQAGPSLDLPEAIQQQAESLGDEAERILAKVAAATYEAKAAEAKAMALVAAAQGSRKSTGKAIGALADALEAIARVLDEKCASLSGEPGVATPSGKEPTGLTGPRDQATTKTNLESFRAVSGALKDRAARLREEARSLLDEAAEYAIAGVSEKAEEPAPVAPVAFSFESSVSTTGTARPGRRRKEKNVVKELIGIVLGGAAGLAIAYYGLNFFGGVRYDFAKIYLPGIKHTVKHRPAWWPTWTRFEGKGDVQDAATRGAVEEKTTTAPPAPRPPKQPEPVPTTQEPAGEAAPVEDAESPPEEETPAESVAPELPESSPPAAPELELPSEPDPTISPDVPAMPEEKEVEEAEPKAAPGTED